MNPLQRPVDGHQDTMRMLLKRMDSIERHRHPEVASTGSGEGLDPRKPKPPTQVEFERVAIGDEPGIQGEWVPPTEYTDGSTPLLLSHYEVEHQLGGELIWSDPTSLHPAQIDSGLTALHDQSFYDGPTLARGVLGSVSDYHGFLYWAWADGLYGVTASDGTVSGISRPHNALMISDGVDGASMGLAAGSDNLLPDGVALPVVSGVTWSVTGGTVGTGSWTLDGHASIQVTASGAWTLSHPRVAITPGSHVGVASANGTITVTLEFYDSDGILTASQASEPSTAGLRTSVLAVAPEGSVSARIVLSGAGNTSVTRLGLFRSEHALLSWRRGADPQVFTNMFTNPDGVAGAATLTTQPGLRNLVNNPTLLTSTVSHTGQNGAVLSRVVTPTSWQGEALLRLTRTTAGNGDILSSSVAAVVAGGPLSARVRVRARSMGNAQSTVTLKFGGATGQSTTVVPDGEWATVSIEGWTATGTSVSLRVEATGASWAPTDTIELDGFEAYQAASLPPLYFDGSTAPRPGMKFSWSGTVGNSASIATLTTEQRRNLATNPEIATTAGYTALSGATLSRDTSLAPPGGTASLLVSGVGFTLPVNIGAHTGRQFTVSMMVLADPGVTITPSYRVGTGAVRTGSPVSGQGRWTRLVLTGSRRNGDSGTIVATIAADGPFRAGQVLVEEAGSAGEFFSGASADTTFIDHQWTGTTNASQSVAVAKTPNGWSAESPMTIISWSPESHASMGSVRLEAAGTDFVIGRFTLAASTNSTVAVWAKAPAGATITLTVYSGTLSRSVDVVSNGSWTELRTPSYGGANTTHAEIAASSPVPLGAMVLNVAEVTHVSGTYTGPAFSGRISTTGVTTAWTGMPDASTSTITLSPVDGAGEGVGSLVSAMDAGGSAFEFLHFHGSAILGDTLYAFLQGNKALPSLTGEWAYAPTGNTYLATFDLVENTLLDVELFANDGIRWGDAVVIESGMVTFLGSRQGQVYLARLNGTTQQGWNGTSWVNSIGTVAPVAQVRNGITGLRQIEGTWRGLTVLETSGGAWIHALDATSLTGPWTPTDAVYDLGFLGGTLPRILSGADVEGAGIAMSFTRDQSPVFLRGPAGAAQSSFAAEIWGGRVEVDDPLVYQAGVGFTEPYRMRVRAVSTSGVVSDWVVGEEVSPQQPDPMVPTPSTPYVQAFFRGARVYWDGLDNMGARYRSFVRYEVHVGPTRSFTPSTWTLHYSSLTEGGLTPVFVPDWDEYWVRIVVVTRLGHSAPSEAVAFLPERLSDSALADLLIDGAKLKPGSVNASALTVAAFSDSLLPNGNFEDVNMSSNPVLPHFWFPGHPAGPYDWDVTDHSLAATIRADQGNPIAGRYSMRIDVPATTTRQLISATIPVTPGDIYYVSVKLRTSSAAASIRVEARLAVSEADVNLATESPTNEHMLLDTIPGSLSTYTFEGDFRVPKETATGEGHSMRFFALSIWADSVGVPYTLWLDDIEVRKVVGTAAIADASINNAKIADAAIDDAKIAYLDAGKIQSGYISSDRIAAGSLTISKIGGLESRLSEKTTTFAQDDIPISTAIGDLWIDTDGQNKMYRAASVGADSIGAGEWELLEGPQAQTTRTFTGPNPPMSQNLGDIWFDTDDNNKMYRAAAVGIWDIGPGAWEPVGQVSTQTFAQPTAPTSVNIGDLWVDTDDNNKMYRASAAGSSTSWVSVNPEILTLVTFAQPDIPTAQASGDLWIDTDDNNKLYRAAVAGSDEIRAGEWELVSPTIVTSVTFAQPTPPTSQNVGDLWVDTDDNNAMYRAATVGATTIGPGAWVLVEPEVYTTITFAQPAVPTALHAGDLWIDTDDGNKMYRAANAGASMVGTGHWELVAQDTFQTFAQDSVPTSVNIGDLWIDTDDGNRMYRAASAGASTIGAGAWESVSQSTSLTFAQGIIPTAVNIGDLWINTADQNKIYRAESVGANEIKADEWVLVAQPTGTRTFAQAAPPTSTAVGDLWVDTDDNNKLYRATVAGSSIIGSGGWVVVAQPTTRTFAQGTIPVSVNAGDLWINTSDGNRMYRAAIVGADQIAAGEWVLVEPRTTKTFAQASPPVSQSIGDMWVDTDDNNKLYRAAAAGTSTIGSGGWVAVSQPTSTTFAQPTIPTALYAGDLWIDTDDGNKMYRAAAVGANTIGSTGWVLVDSNTTTTFAQGAVPTALTAGDLWINTADNNRMYRAVIAGADEIKAGEWVLVAQPVAVTFAQGTIPTAQNIGDIWIDTSDGNKMYRAGSIGANEITGGEWVLVDNTIFQEAATIVNGWRYTGTTEIDGGNIRADTIQAGSLTLGVLRSNLVPDGSLEEHYDLSAYDPFGQWAGVGWTVGNINQWRRGNDSGGTNTPTRDHSGQLARSGTSSLLIHAAGSASQGSVYSPAVPLEVGKTYRLVVYAAVTQGTTASRANMQVIVQSNSNPSISGFEGSQSLTSDEPYNNSALSLHYVNPVLKQTLDASDFKMYAFTFTATDTWAQIRILNYQPPGASTLIIDDVSLIEVGIGGAMELGPHGLRLFDDDGFESGAWVTNRPSTFTITQNGMAVASISDTGDAAFHSLSAGDPNTYTGVEIYGTEFMEWMDQRGRGIVAYGAIPTGNTWNNTTDVYHLDFAAEQGRTYRVHVGSSLAEIGATNRGTGLLLATLTPTTNNGSTLGSRVTRAWAYGVRQSTTTDWWTLPSMERVLRCDPGTGGSAWELRAGTNRISVYTNAQSSATLKLHDMAAGVPVYVEDIGPYIATEGTYVYVPGSEPPPPTKKTYTSTWAASGSRSYNPDGTEAKGGGNSTIYDMVHGPVPGDGRNRYAIAAFDSGAISGENGKTIASALSGATVKKVEVYIYANHWYYNGGGTAYIRARNTTGIPGTGSTGSTGSVKTFSGWAVGQGKWVDITSVSTAAIRGILIGATGSSSLTTYGRFNGATQSNKPQLRITYER